MPVTKNRLYLLILCSLFAALCAIGAFIKVPLAWLPITLQTFFSTLAGLLLGKKVGHGIRCRVSASGGLIGLPYLYTRRRHRLCDQANLWLFARPSPCHLLYRSIV